MNTLCSQCNAPISCNPTGNCWCFTLPPLLPVPANSTQTCLCRACLTNQLESSPSPDVD